MILWILALLITGAPYRRPYYPVAVCNMAKNHHTHVSVTGEVVEVTQEADGDLHIRLQDGKCFVVAECIPELPCKKPRLGQGLTVRGISRFDGEHKWWEVHPVESQSGGAR